MLFLVLPGALDAASLGIAPRSGSYEVGRTFSVAILVTSIDEAFNAVSGRLMFPPDVLEVVSLSKSQSVISLWVQEPLFSNSSGNISFEGVVLNPGHKGNAANIITVQFKVKKAGIASVSFTSGEILANDGVGTSILSSLEKGSYTLVSPTAAIVAPVVTEEKKPIKEDSSQVLPQTPLPKVVSISHPEQSWSALPNGVFNFDFGDAVIAMRLLVDTKPDSIPVVVYQPPIKERIINDLSDGISYLHVQLKDKNGWGEVTHYPLQVDTKKPQQLKVSEIEAGENEVIAFEITAKDDLSGVQRYEVTINGGEPIVIIPDGEVSRFSPQGLVAGAYTLEVKAFDKAGNFTVMSQQFQVPENPIVQLESLSLLKTLADQNVRVSPLLIGIVLFFFVTLFALMAFYVRFKVRFLAEQGRRDIAAVELEMANSIVLLKSELEKEIDMLKKRVTKKLPPKKKL